jgi:hypothetical protein
MGNGGWSQSDWQMIVFSVNIQSAHNEWKVHNATGRPPEYSALPCILTATSSQYQKGYAQNCVPNQY